MKICVAQTRPVKGDIHHNLDVHYKLIQLALAHDAEVIVFPELSLTGYEPELAASLAVDENADIFDHLQELSDKFGITIGVGMPKKLNVGVSISTIIFQPQHIRQVYSKKYLHKSETQHFTTNESFNGLIGPLKDIALGICYEMSIPEHFEDIAATTASFYINSSVKDHESLGRSYGKMADAARGLKLTTLLANCVGTTGGYDCPGGSAIWDNNGELLHHLDSEHEGILIYDTVSKEIFEKYLES